MTLNNEKGQPVRRAMFGNQAQSNDAEPFKPRQPTATAPFRLGNFAKSLMAQAQSEDSCLSPNTIQKLVNPMRSQLGLPSLALYMSPQEPAVEQREEPNKRTSSGGEKNDSGVDTVDSNSNSRNDFVIEPGNDILNISFTGEPVHNPSHYESFNMNDQSGIAGLTSFGIPSHIQDNTRSFAQPRTGDDLSNWSIGFGGGGDYNNSFDMGGINNKSIADNNDEDNNNESQDSFMLNRRKMTYDDSIDIINHPFDKMSLIATERSRCTAASPNMSGNLWGMTRALSTPDLSSNKITMEPTDQFNFPEDKSEIYKPQLDYTAPLSPAFTRPVGITFSQNQSMKMTGVAQSKDKTDRDLPYPSSGYVLSSSRQPHNSLQHHQPRKLSKVDEVSSGSSTFSITQPPSSRQFGRCLDSETDARELSRELLNNNQGSNNNFTFNKPTPLKQSFVRKLETTPKTSIMEDNNSINIPEIAARIPANSRGSGGETKKCTKSGTPMSTGRHIKSLGNPPSSSGKHKASSKDKKPTAGSGWKFSSEHVEGKEYLAIKSLGKGGCGEVFLVIEKESRQLFALKKVSLAGIDDASVQECVNEVQMLVDLKDSDLVVHIFSWEFNKSEKTMKIVMEHGQCDLNFSIRTVNSTVLKLKSIWERILMIVDFIHKRGIVHADLKPANFIWAGDNLKIIDFGIASRLQQDHTSIAMLCPKGTLNFISPETIQPDALGRAKIGPKSDIWSLGCILYLMVYGRTPFEYIAHPVAKMNAIVKGDIAYPPLPPQLQASASELLSVLKSCFQHDYRMRPTTAELLCHPFLRKL